MFKLLIAWFYVAHFTLLSSFKYRIHEMRAMFHSVVFIAKQAYRTIARACVITMMKNFGFLCYFLTFLDRSTILAWRKWQLRYSNLKEIFQKTFYCNRKFDRSRFHLRIFDLLHFTRRGLSIWKLPTWNA